MGNTCKPMAVSFQCMTKSTTKKKKRSLCILQANISKRRDSKRNALEHEEIRCTQEIEKWPIQLVRQRPAQDEMRHRKQPNEQTGP